MNRPFFLQENLVKFDEYFLLFYIFHNDEPLAQRGRVFIAISASYETSIKNFTSYCVYFHVHRATRLPMVTDSGNFKGGNVKERYSYLVIPITVHKSV